MISSHLIYIYAKNETQTEMHTSVGKYLNNWSWNEIFKLKMDFSDFYILILTRSLNAWKQTNDVHPHCRLESPVGF